MNARQPVLFVSHGAPDVVRQPGATLELWKRLGAELPRPRAILVVSAHWTTRGPQVSSAPQPETIHDFGGFPPDLYARQYPAPGAPALAERVVALMEAASLPIAITQNQGLDHGAWIPLSQIYPEADIPVAQLSIQPYAGPDWHRRLGVALRPLRDEGVLILASGAITHNFGWLNWEGGPALPQARQFADWVGAALAEDDRPRLQDYRRLTPLGVGAHPSEDHLLPLFSALGAAEHGELPLRLEPEYTYAGLAKDAYLWQDHIPRPFTAVKEH